MLNGIAYALTVLHNTKHHSAVQGPLAECAKKCHHTSLCESFPADIQPPSVSSQPTNSQSASSQQISSQSTTLAAAKQQAPAQPTSGYNSALPTALYTSVCLLKTAIAEVSSHTTIAEGHMLFDEGVQRSFITQQLADELYLQPTSHEIISVSSFGAQVSISRSFGVATVLVCT